MGMTTYHHPVPLSCNLGTLTSWNPLGHSRSVMGLLYLLFIISEAFIQRLLSLVFCTCTAQSCFREKILGYYLSCFYVLYVILVLTFLGV